MMLGGPDVRGPTADAHDAWPWAGLMWLMLMMLGGPDVRGPTADAHDAWPWADAHDARRA